MPCDFKTSSRFFKNTFSFFPLKTSLPTLRTRRNGLRAQRRRLYQSSPPLQVVAHKGVTNLKTFRIKNSEAPHHNSPSVLKDPRHPLDFKDKIKRWVSLFVFPFVSPKTVFLSSVLSSSRPVSCLPVLNIRSSTVVTETGDWYSALLRTSHVDTWKVRSLSWFKRWKLVFSRIYSINLLIRIRFVSPFSYRTEYSVFRRIHLG